MSRSFEAGQIPDDWRKACIMPLYKKGNRSDPGNYRPVNLTSNTCKLMEKIVKNEVERYIETNALMSNTQHGFRRGRSPQTNLIEC